MIIGRTAAYLPRVERVTRFRIRPFHISEAALPRESPGESLVIQETTTEPSWLQLHYISDETGAAAGRGAGGRHPELGADPICDRFT